MTRYPGANPAPHPLRQRLDAGEGMIDATAENLRRAGLSRRPAGLALALFLAGYAALCATLVAPEDWLRPDPAGQAAD